MRVASQRNKTNQASDRHAHPLVRYAYLSTQNQEATATTPSSGQGLFFDRRPLPFGGSHLRLPIRTTTGSLSALGRPTPYQLSHRVASVIRPGPSILQFINSWRSKYFWLSPFPLTPASWRNTSPLSRRAAKLYQP